MIETACHDNQADNYDNSVKIAQDNEKDFIRENYDKIHFTVIDELCLRAGNDLLDIGIGTGLLEEKISLDINIHGIDISKRMLEKVKEKGLNVELKEATFTDLPYPIESFDRIVSCFAFHHLNDQEKEKAFSEIFRVLKKDGIFVLADFTYEGNIQILKNYFLKIDRKDMFEEMEKENFTSIDWMKEQARKYEAKLKVVRGSTMTWVGQFEQFEQ